MKRLTRYFLEGMLFLTPVVATLYVVYIVFIKIDGIFKFEVPGLGFLVTVLAITMIGFVTSNFLAGWLARGVDRMFRRLPLVKLVYTSVKDLINAFVGNKKGFTRPVRVALDPEGKVQAMGFVTKESLDGFGITDMVAVYLPQSYNFAGNLLLVPKSRVTPLEVLGADVMTFVVSGGISSKQS